tara:strand:- start:47 stop:487 length:441 start_codon:yes stop_codon:yes gene_type:complete
MVAVTAHLSLWMLATLVTIVRTGQMYEKATLIRDLNLEIQSAPPGTKLVIMDIGSNDGTWTAEMVMPIVRSALRKGLAPHAYIVEPQPNFREHLSRLAQQMGAHMQRSSRQQRGRRTQLCRLPNSMARSRQLSSPSPKIGEWEAAV